MKKIFSSLPFRLLVALAIGILIAMKLGGDPEPTKA